METPKTYSDEIDLGDLLLKIVLAIKRNLGLIVGFFIIGTALGFTYSMLAQKVYESKMMVTSDVLTDSYADKLSQNLDAVILDGNVDLLASRLSLTPEEAGKVSSIVFEGVQKEKPLIDEQGKETVQYYFLITARVYDPQILPKLEKGLVSYLENNEFTKARVEQKRHYAKAVIKKLEEELQTLEDFKERVYKGDFFEKNKGNVGFNPAEINGKIVDLSKDRLSYQNDLDFVSSVEIVEGFTQFNTPVKPKRIISLIAGASFGLFMVGALIAFKGIRQIVRKAEQQQNK